MLNLGHLVNTVQKNCHISDARHAGDFTLCIFLLKMREFYRWEQGLPFGAALGRGEVGDWLAGRLNWPAVPEPLVHALQAHTGGVPLFD